jgi:phospholipid/cholesterol/gamma-HCH transport system substrate-binding protein
MGTKYIEIEPGGSEDFITEGGEFSYTQDAMVLEELVDRIISVGKANRKKTVTSAAESSTSKTMENE